MKGVNVHLIGGCVVAMERHMVHEEDRNVTLEAFDLALMDWTVHCLVSNFSSCHVHVFDLGGYAVVVTTYC